MGHYGVKKLISHPGEKEKVSSELKTFSEKN